MPDKITFFLLTELIRDNAIDMCRNAPKGWIATFRAPTRSLEQNRKMWAMLTDISRQVEHQGQRYSSDDWKILIMQAVGFELRMAPSINSSGIVQLGTSSSKLNISQMMDMIEFMFAYGAEKNVVWSERDMAA